LFTELKRRNVLRMAALYIAAAWLCLEVAGALIDLSVLPGTMGPWVVVLLAIGFPIALVVSWFFELTSEGVALDKEVQARESTAPFGGRRTDFVIIAVLSAALLMFAYDKWWDTGPDDLSIAVLAFDNLSSDPEQEYFSDGISDEILNLLAQIQPLRVTARTSSFWFKGKDVKIADIANELNVRHILEGSVRRDGNRVRITAQLIDARDSSNLWSQVYDRDLSAASLFHVQSEVARAISGRLKIALTEPEEQRLARVPTEDTEAYEAYLIGRDRLRDRKVAGLKDAVEQFALAIELDPEFAGAYSGLADACLLYRSYSGGHSSEHCPSSPVGLEQLARKALELDSESGEAWISLGAALIEQGRYRPPEEHIPKVREALAAYELGLQLNPTQSQGYDWYASALRMIFYYPDPPMGWIEAWRSGAWQSVYDRGLEVDPLSIHLHRMKARYPVNTSSKEEAIRHAQRLVEIAPDSPLGYEILGEQQWALKGRLDESVPWMSKAMGIDPQNPEFPGFIGLAYSELGDPDMALAYFDLARTLTAPDDQRAQHDLLLEQAIVRQVSGREDPEKAAELRALLSEPKSFSSIGLGTFIDLAAGRPGKALARIEALFPPCFTVTDFAEEAQICPNELVRIYQELGDHAAARDLADKKIRYYKIWVDGTQGALYHPPYVRVLAASGRVDEALDEFEESVTSGWRGNQFLLSRFALYFDVTFDAIRDDERFQTIVARFEADMAQQLENVRAMQRRGEVPTLEEVKAMIASAEQEPASDGE
jgi:TolB-like protein/cytochrome c-type biogenesis protein CcmH/NrfG